MEQFTQQTASSTFLDFEGNSAGLVGGAISSTNTEFNISGEAVFLRNMAKYGNGGAMELVGGTVLLQIDGNLNFTENFAGQLTGGAVL